MISTTIERQATSAFGNVYQFAGRRFDDQAGLFARGEMKRIRWTRDDVEAGARRRYRPGEEGKE